MAFWILSEHAPPGFTLDYFQEVAADKELQFIDARLFSQERLMMEQISDVDGRVIWLGQNKRLRQEWRDYESWFDLISASDIWIYDPHDAESEQGFFPLSRYRAAFDDDTWHRAARLFLNG